MDRRTEPENKRWPKIESKACWHFGQESAYSACEECRRMAISCEACSRMAVQIVWAFLARGGVVWVGLHELWQPLFGLWTLLMRHSVHGARGAVAGLARAMGAPRFQDLFFALAAARRSPPD